MKEFEKIPVTKVERATKFISTGAKIGGNYLKHYGKKLVNPAHTTEELHENNAATIYQSLSELKGSALKVAQMLSMDKNILPVAYQDKFAMAQYSAPPLSYPLVVKTFHQFFGKSPDQIFDTFSKKAMNAASMGQVHQAMIRGKKLAVKIQYPGVGNSVKSDLAMVKPIALSMFKLNAIEYDEYIHEVESRMLEETDYRLELSRSVELTKKCSHLENITFPKYYPELSSMRVLTMDWIDGKPLGEFLKQPIDPAIGTKLGQAMWDFYHFQMHQLKVVHADPHPGNFIVTPDHTLGIIDFGCVKVIPDEFYKVFFKLLSPKTLANEDERLDTFYKLKFIHKEDSAKDRRFFIDLFTKLVALLARPFESKAFDFSDEGYFNELYAYGEALSKMDELRKSKRVRGVRDAIYINRTYFGLYSLLNQLRAKIEIGWQGI